MVNWLSEKYQSFVFYCEIREKIRNEASIYRYKKEWIRSLPY